eukprot:scaffold120_cov279-Chaetoceros_neogracile.AAC.2
MLSSLRLVAQSQTPRCVNMGLSNLTSIRSKHSKTQIKRIFRQNPAFLRIASRKNTLPKALTSQPEALTLKTFFTPTILPNGWSAPPTEEDFLKQRDELPFAIKRTGNKPHNAIGFLPVYSSVRLGGTKHTTIIKKVKGDQELFLRELRAVLEIGAENRESVRVRASGGTIEVNGNRVREVKAWLAGLGF